MIVKLAYKNEIRICSSIDSFSGLLKQVKVIFPSSPTHPHLYYIDTDGDKITISSTSDIQSLKQISNGKIIKIQIDVIETKETATQNQQIPEPEIILNDDLLKQIVSINLDKTYAKAVKSLQIEEQEIIQDLAKFHIYQIGQKALNSVLDKISSKQVQVTISSRKTPRSKSIDNIKSQKQIEKLVDKKIKLLIPSLVQRVAKLVQLRNQRQTKQNCEQCNKFKKIISQNLLNTTDICNQQEFEEIFEMVSDNKLRKY